jgi:hypothetical protein
MKKGNLNIDRIFSGKLKDFKAEPPHEVWDEVVRSLDQERRRKRIAVFMRVAAVISLLAVLTITALLVRDASTSRQVVEESRTGDSTLQEEAMVAGDTREEISAELPGDVVEDKEKKRAVENEDVIQKETYLADYQEEIVAGKGSREMTVMDREVAETNWPGTLVSRYIFRISGDHGGVSDQPVRRTTREVPVIPVPDDTKKDDYVAENLLDEDFSSGGTWGIGTNATPLYSFRHLGATDAAEPMVVSGTSYDQLESGTMAYAGGVHVNYMPGRRLSFQSGIYYSKMGINVDHNYYVNNLASVEDVSNLRLNYSQVRNTTGVINTSDKEETEFAYVSNESWDRAPRTRLFKINELNATIYEGQIIQDFEYLEIPMLVRYRLIDRKIGFNVLGGVSTNLLVGSDAWYTDNNTKEKIGKTTNLKPVNYSSIVGLGLDYAITRNLYVNLEPTFRYYINSVNTTGLKSHPYSMGIFTGLSYIF